MLDAAIRLEGAPNFRDLGGYVGAGGRGVRHSKLFRSGSLSRLTAGDFGLVARLGVRLVCDLRSAAERAHRTMVWPSNFRPDVMCLDVNADVRAGNEIMLGILRRDPTERGAVAMMLESYRVIPLALQSGLGELFRRIAAREATPLIFHCSAGKDRTGVLSAVLLLALGVSREDVVADYLLTQRFGDMSRVESTVAEVTAHLLGAEPSAAVVSAIASVRETYIETALRSIEESHGSVANYLAAAGVDAELLDKVREHLLHQE